MANVEMDLGVDDVSTPEVLGAPAPSPAKKKARRRRSRVTITHPTHGTIDIMQMKGVMHGDACLLTSASSGDDSAPVWIQIAKQGKFLGHSAGPFEMNLQTFEEIIRNFKAHPEHIPIDFEHASESDASSGSIPTHGAPAQGWITDMKIEGGNLWGLVDWGALAREYIREGKYRHFSPAIRFGSKDRVTGKPIGARMSSGALTNSPYLASMQQVAAKHTESEDDDLTDEDEDEDTEAPVDGSSLQETKMADDKLAVTLSDSIARNEDLATKLAATEGKVVALEGKLAASDAELTAMKAKESERVEAEVAADVDEAIKHYPDLKPEARTALMSFARSDRASFKSLYPKKDKNVPAAGHLLRNMTENTREPAPTSQAEPQRISVVELARQISTQRGVSLGQAQQIAVQMRDQANRTAGR